MRVLRSRIRGLCGDVSNERQKFNKTKLTNVNSLIMDENRIRIRKCRVVLHRLRNKDNINIAVINTDNKIHKEKSIMLHQPSVKCVVRLKKIQQNSTMYFQLVNQGHNKNIEQKKKKIRMEKNENIFREDNSVKVNEIGSLHNMLSCNGEENEQNNNKIEPIMTRKSKRFFHRNDGKKNTKPTNKHIRRQSPNRRVSKVYDFLIQSQNSKMNNFKYSDPTADIISRLISEGKVRVATHCKGKGRPIVKRCIRKPNTKTCQNNPKQQQRKEMKSKNPPKLKNTQVQGKQIISMGDDNISGYHLMNNMQSHIAHPSINCFSPADNIQKYTKTKNNQKQHAYNLLQVARKIISTPKNPNMTSLNATICTEVSPISLYSQTNFQNTSLRASPWRMDGINKSKIFAFANKSNHLSSFSRDNIPNSPLKDLNKSKVNQFLQSQKNSRCILSNTKNSLNSILSLPPTNISYCENLSPDIIRMNKNKNENTVSLRQFSNVHRNVKKRSPLKPINILQVVTLPPWKKLYSNIINKSEDIDKGCNISLDNITRNGRENSNNIEKTPALPMKDVFFGFEDYITSSDTDNDESTKVVHINNKNLHEKLFELRKWRPQTLVKTGTQNRKLSRLNLCSFNVNDNKIDPLQRNIKEMMCPQMIKPIESRNNSVDDYTVTSKQQNEVFESNELFKDDVLLSSLNQKNINHTYIRPCKRKRRLCEKNFVVYFESDESDNEKNKSLVEKNSPDNCEREKAPKRKCLRKNINVQNQKLNDFVTEFNTICNEVEKYELLIEKST